MKLKFNVMERFVLNATYQEVLSNGSARDQIAAQGLLSIIGFSMDDYTNYDIKEEADDQGRVFTKWNEKGMEHVEFDIHQMAVSLLCKKALQTIEREDLNAETVATCFNLFKQVHDNEQKELVDADVLEKVEAKYEELDELYKIFHRS